ncbi:MAG: sulfite exporter TauE/SafE family protein [Planctomycetaceae bacterium]|nr:sulfite exporter TauE/SafE family protein [Planctomycetaceae bacterium]
MSLADAFLLIAAAFGAGVMNSIAGGGTFLTLPMLIFTGVPAKIANATSTVALWPGSVASAIGYLPELKAQRGRRALFAISFVGGLLGALLLLATGESTFRLLIPWLLLVATVLFAAGPAITRRLRKDAQSVPDLGRLTAATAVSQFAIAVYGGYFGAGIGILMLAALALSGMDDLHAMNGLKNGLATAINGIAVITFVAMDLLPLASMMPWLKNDDVLWWPQVFVMMLAAIAGGLVGVKLARVLPTRVTRTVITTIGTVLTVAFFYKTYA